VFANSKLFYGLFQIFAGLGLLLMIVAVLVTKEPQPLRIERAPEGIEYKVTVAVAPRLMTVAAMIFGVGMLGCGLLMLVRPCRH
jgi:hypothetical protein